MSTPKVIEVHPRVSSFAVIASGAALADARAEISELKRKLAEKTPDYGDDEQETEPDDAPRKEGKKKKVKATDDEEASEPEDTTPDRDEPKPKGAAYWSKAFRAAKNRASPEAILGNLRARGVMPPEGSAMSVEAYRQRVATAAAMVVHCAEIARGAIDPPLPPKGSYARMILDAGAEARGQELDGE